MREEKQGSRFGYIFFLFGTVAILLAGLLFLNNHREDQKAFQRSEAVMLQFYTQTETPEIWPDESGQEREIPDYILNPDMEMPTVEIDGNAYIGYLLLPTLDVELPVMSGWSYPGLRISPCRYTGSIYKGNAVIAAHNYDCHFGQLFHLKPGDPVQFTDVDGNVFRYEIVTHEVLEPTAVEEMTESDFELSLFTCTYGGATRYTIRCQQLANE